MLRRWLIPALSAVLLLAAKCGVAAAAVSLRGFYGNEMVFQSGLPARLVGTVAPGKQAADTRAGPGAGVQVEVLLDGVVAGRAMADARGDFSVEIGPQPATAVGHPGHMLEVTAAGVPEPARLTGVLFGDVYLCTGQSNMALSMAQAEATPSRACPLCNSSAEIKAAGVGTSLRLAVVGMRWSATAPQNDTRLSTSWSPAAPAVVANFSALCYYLGKEMFEKLGGRTSIGLIQSAVGGTYIQSFMPPEALAVCHNTGCKPAGWVPTTGPAGEPFNPWGAQNVPSALWYNMLHPLLPLQFKLAVFDQAEHNLA
eukprot:SAG22_NODE_5611_length_985_cov_1.076749_1_plen_311_part_10